MQLDRLAFLPRKFAVEDAEDYDLAGTHVIELLMEMSILNELEKAFCHRFCCALAQSHVIGICLVGIIAPFQSRLRLFCGVLCSITCRVASIIQLFRCGRSASVLCAGDVRRRRELW